MCIRMLIADDQPRARHSLTALLTAMRWSTPNQAGQSTLCRLLFLSRSSAKQRMASQAVEQVRALHPDVVVLDLQLHTVFAA